jgi:hypothetical protein
MIVHDILLCCGNARIIARTGNVFVTARPDQRGFPDKVAARASIGEKFDMGANRSQFEDR